MIINPSIKRISVLGCGWFGLPLASRLIQAGFLVAGSTTTLSKLSDLNKTGIDPYLLSFDPNLSCNIKIELFFDSDVLIINIPPSVRSGNGVSRYRLIIDNLMPHITASSISHVVFISSTSVYPDLNRVVTEQDAGSGTLSESGKILFETENLFLNRQEFETTILRFGGLYGPNRHPAKFLSGKKEIKNPEGPVNLVHLEDCIRITERIIRKRITNQCLSVVSDEHPSRKNYYTTMCERLGIPLPEFLEQTETDNWKQVTNRRLKQVIDYHFKYASPFDGV